MRFFTEEELSLPEGEYGKRKDFQYFFLLYTAGNHFARRYLQESYFTLLRKKFLKDSSQILSCAADGFACMENKKEDIISCKMLFAESRVSLGELAGNYQLFLKMKKYRIFSCDSHIMLRFRSFHIRSMESFRDWISIERYDSDLLYDSTPEKDREKMLFYPSSAELAANGLLQMCRSAEYMMRYLEKKSS